MSEPTWTDMGARIRLLEQQMAVMDRLLASQDNTLRQIIGTLEQMAAVNELISEQLTLWLAERGIVLPTIRTH